MKKITLFFGILFLAFFLTSYVSAYDNDSVELPEQSSTFSSLNAQIQTTGSAYTISYDLNGGKWQDVNKEEMKIDFLIDYFNYVNPTENLLAFMHGVGKTSGYDGLWHSKYIDLLYQANDKEANVETPFFINQPAYNAKWVQFFDLLEIMVKETNPDQSFWASPYTGKIRIREYFTGERYADDNRLPANLPLLLDYYKSYQSKTLPLSLPIPIRDKYVFLGWYDNPEFTGEAITSLGEDTTGDKEFYANWEGVAYEITYQINGGSFSFVDRNALKDAFLLDFYNFINPVEDLNTFKHGVGKTSGYDGTWHSTYKDYLYQEDLKVIEKGSVYFINRPEYNSRWLPFYNLLDEFIKEINPEQNLWNDIWAGLIRFRQYFIDDALFANKITLPVCGPHLKYLYDSNKVTLANPTKSGVTFLGWYANPNFTGTMIEEISTYSTGAKVFYAKWGHSITYVLNGGVNDQKNPNFYTSDLLPITLKQPTRNSYNFLGWYTNPNFTGNALTTLAVGSTGNMTLYAKWELAVHPITYNLNGGVNNPDNPATYNVNTLPVSVHAPERSGYTFKGWYQNANFTGEVVTSFAVGTTGAKTLHAKWEAIPYTITYNLNGGVNNPNNPTTYNNDLLPLSLSAATRTGYTFKGWYDNPDFTGNNLTSLALGTIGNKNFYAKWELTNYSITYNLNGGVNNVNNPAIYNINSLPVSLQAPTRTGYTFKGWYQNANFTGEIVTSFAVGTTGTKTLHAKWEAIPYTITYNLNGGVNNANNPDLFIASDLPISLLAPTRSGYAFAGWYDNPNFTGNKVLEINTIGNKTFYAKWEEITSYGVTYELNGGKWQSPTKNDLKIDFLIDFYNYIRPTESLETFMHGASKSSGFDGTWHSLHKDKLYEENNKAANPASPYFINQPAYNSKWVPFFDLIEEMIKETNPDQSLWGDIWAGQIRLREYFTGERYADDNRLPANLPTLLDYKKNYNKDTLPLTLPIPTRTSYTFGGWYVNANFTGSAVTTIPIGSTGNKTYYAKWEDREYTLAYTLNGGAWTFGSRNALKDAFLLDFYNFLQPTENLNTFKHGAGKTSGYDGTWHSVYKDRLYNINSKGVIRGSEYFINQPEYNAKWVPFFNLLEQFVKEINPAQSFWGSTWTGLIRIREYFIDHSNFSGKNTLPTCPGPTRYFSSSNKITLPTPRKSGSTFEGWYLNASFTGSRIYEIPTGSSGNKTFYAKWSAPTYIPVNGYMDLSYSGNQTLLIGSSQKITPAWKKSTITGDTFTYTSSNALVASVNSSGTISGLSAGSAIITIRSAKTNATVQIGFTVYASNTNAALKYLITQNTGKILSQNVLYYGFTGNYWNRVHSSVNNYLAAPHDTVNTSLWLQGGIKGSGTAMTPRYITVHDTGAAGSGHTAYNQGSWCVNPTNTGSSWHYTVGNDGVYQHISRYRRAWHAGDGSGPGNTQSIGIETAVNTGSHLWWTYQKTAKLVGRIMVEEGLTMSALKYHQNWSGKVCPQTMIRAGLIPRFEKLVEAEYTVRKNYSNYTITFQSHNTSILNNQGRVISAPAKNTNVSYTITVKSGSNTYSATLYGIVPGTETY